MIMVLLMIERSLKYDKDGSNQWELISRWRHQFNDCPIEDSDKDGEPISDNWEPECFDDLDYDFDWEVTVVMIIVTTLSVIFEM